MIQRYHWYIYFRNNSTKPRWQITKFCSKNNFWFRSIPDITGWTETVGYVGGLWKRTQRNVRSHCFIGLREKNNLPVAEVAVNSWTFGLITFNQIVLYNQIKPFSTRNIYGLHDVLIGWVHNLTNVVSHAVLCHLSPGHIRRNMMFLSGFIIVYIMISWKIIFLEIVRQFMMYMVVIEFQGKKLKYVCNFEQV